MNKEFELINLLGIKMSSYKFYSLDQLVEDPFTIFYTEKNDIPFTRQIVKDIIYKHNTGGKDLFRTESVAGKLIIKLEEEFVENFQTLYLNSYISELQKSDLIFWLLYGNQFLFLSNILSSYQEFNITNSGTFNIFKSLIKTDIKNTYVDSEGTTLYYIKHLQADHTKLDGNLRLRVTKNALQGIVDYQEQNKIKDFYSVSIYWSGDHPLFTVEKVDPQFYNNKISVDGRFQSFKISNLLIADNVSEGIITVDGESFRTRDKTEILKFLYKETLNKIDYSVIRDIEESVIRNVNFTNYVASFKDNMSKVKHLRELSLENSKQLLIGLVGEFATINVLEVENEVPEENIRWESEINYGSSYDIEVVDGDDSFKYEVKSSIYDKSSIFLSSREYDTLSVDPNNSYFVKVVIDQDILEKYSELTDKDIWKNYIRNDIDNDLISVEFNDWISIRDNVSPYKYKVDIN